MVDIWSKLSYLCTVIINHLKQITTMKNLIGKQIRGFKFIETENCETVGWNNSMETYIGKLGTIIEAYGDYVRVKFEDGKNWVYPINLIKDHLVGELPERGDTILVWDDGMDPDEAIFLAFIPGAALPVICVQPCDEDNFRNEIPFDTLSYQYWKPASGRVKLTLQDIADKFGIDVNRLEIEE